jgi:hypothetical protein
MSVGKFNAFLCEIAIGLIAKIFEILQTCVDTKFMGFILTTTILINKIAD